MATNIKPRVAFIALGLISLLMPVTVAAGELVGQVPEDNSPLVLYLSSGPCQECLRSSFKPTCGTACTLPLVAVVQNLNGGAALTVEMTMTLTFPWVPGPVRCGQGDVVQVQIAEVPPGGQAVVDFGPLLHGAFRGVNYTVTTRIIASDDPGLVGLVEVEYIPVRTFWLICGE